MSLKFIQLLIVLIFPLTLLHAQDFSWWNEKHNWDGYSPWTNYLTISTSKMGPNALPVPEVANGIIDSTAELEVAGEYIFSKGDKTMDLYLRGYLPLYENRFSISLDVIPYEWYTTDTLTRDERAARDESGKGGAGGDIYLATSFQLFKDRSIPDIVFRATLRTASGTNLRNARYTDGAGYFFDINFGKNIFFNANILRLYGMLGFYEYQTFDVEHLQDDCFLYGVGADLNVKRFTLTQSFAGYNGYLDIGDQPMIYRTALRMKNKLIDWKLTYQWGIRDYDFQRIKLSLIYKCSQI